MSQILAVIERDGGVIVHNFLEPDLMKRLNSELDSQLDATVPGSRSEKQLWQAFHGRNTKRICGLTARCPSFVEVLTHPTLLEYADHAVAAKLRQLLAEHEPDDGGWAG